MATVLLIEDDHQIRISTSELLELVGYETLEAADGETGVDLAYSKLPDIILCDINMPYKNGYDVLKEIKANEQTSGIPFYFLTAVVEKKSKELADLIGADGLIVKPFKDKDILDVLKSALE